MIGNWRDLGLKGRAEASAMGLIYSREIKAHNGDRANEVIDAIARTYHELRSSLGVNQAVRPQKRQNRGGGNSSAPARYERPSDDANRERSLFDDVAETAARDRDQLEGKRLTAQMNAPLTREEQLKKLKRSKDKPQTSLFGDDEEPPAQGILNENLLTQKRAYLEELWKKEVPEAQVRAQSDRVEAMRERLLEFLSKFEGTKN